MNQHAETQRAADELVALLDGTAEALPDDQDDARSAPQRLSREAVLWALGQWQQAIQRADALMLPAVNALALPPESPPWLAVQELQTAVTTMTAALVGDSEECLSWFWQENDMGTKALEVHTPDHPPRPIRTLADLAWLLGYDQ
jgi:hypothetical protein